MRIYIMIKYNKMRLWMAQVLANRLTFLIRNKTVQQIHYKKVYLLTIKVLILMVVRFG